MPNESKPMSPPNEETSRQTLSKRELLAALDIDDLPDTLAVELEDLDDDSELDIEDLYITSDNAARMNRQRRNLEMTTKPTPKAAACDKSAAKRLIRNILFLETGGTISQSRLFTLAYYADCALALETGKRTGVWRRGSLGPLCEDAERAVAVLAASGELNHHALSLHPENALLVFNEI